MYLFAKVAVIMGTPIKDFSTSSKISNNLDDFNISNIENQISQKHKETVLNQKYIVAKEPDQLYQHFLMELILLGGDHS